jgi:syntaxin-binding protein 5
MVVDMRGPAVILRETQAQSNRRQSFLKFSGDHADPIVSLQWGVFKTDSGLCSLEASLNISLIVADIDPLPHVRLIATRISGHSAIYTVKRDVAGGFSASQQLTRLDGVPTPFRSGSFVLDSKTGTPCVANRSRFSTTLHDHPPTKVPDVFWVSVGAKGAKCTFNVDGDRIAKIDWGSKIGQVENVKIVQRYGKCY